MIDSLTPAVDLALSAMVVVAVAPLLALLAAGCLQSQRFPGSGRWIAGLGCATSLAATIVLTTAQAVHGDPAGPAITVFRWLSVPGDGLTVTMGLHADRLTNIFLLLAASVTTVVSIASAGAGRDTLESRGPWRLLFPFSAMVLLVLSTNFVQLFFFWRLLTLAADWTTRDSLARPSRRTPQLFVVHHAADLAFVLGICLIWVNFGSIELQRVLMPSQIAAVAERQPAAIAGICVCLFAGVMGKAAQIPLATWLPEIARGPAGVAAILHAATLLPAGVYVVVRCYPLFIAAPAAQSLMAFVGGFTALLAAIVAAGQKDLRDALSFATASQLGLIFLGLSTASFAGVAAALFVLISCALAVTLLFLAAGQVRRATQGITDLSHLGGLRRVVPSARWSFVAGSLIAGSAVWGQDAVLNAVWNKAEAVADSALASQIADSANPVPERSTAGGAEAAAVVQPGNIFGAMHWLATLSLSFTAFALFRAYYLTFRELRDGGVGRTVATGPKRKWLWLFPAGAAVGLRVCFGEPFSLFERIIEPMFSPFLDGTETVEIVGLGIPAALLGMVTAWMFYSRPSVLAERVARSAGAFVRLSQHGFYLTDFYRLFLAFPLRFVAATCRWCEWLLFDVIERGSLRLVPVAIARTARPMQNGTAQLDALAFLLGAAVLLSALLWLQN